MNPQEIDDEAREFVGYWLSPDAKNPLKRDWDGTFKRRIREVAHRVVQRRGRPKFRSAEQPSLAPATAADIGLWRLRVDGWKRDRRTWVPMFGPEPGQPGCQAPAELLDKPPDVKVRVDAELVGVGATS